MCCVQATERRGLQNENDRFLQQQTYKLISGHRRLSAIKLLSEKGKWNSGTVPCYVITAKKSEAEMNLDLIMLNHTQRKYSDADIFKEHEELKKIFTQLEADGVEIKGRLREKIAKAMHVSSAQIGKIENIKNKMFINEQLFRNNSERTLIWYNENLSAFFNWLGENKNVDSLTVDNYKLYCTFRQHDYVKCNGQPLKSSSVNSRVRAVKAFYNYCIEEDLLPNFSKKLKATKIRKSEKFPLDDDEIHTLISAFGDSELEERNRCWVILMCDSGLRRGEIINLQIGNVHLERGFMIVTGKGDKQRFVPLGELSKISLSNYIHKYRNEAKESEPVFVNRFGEKCTINTVKQVFQKLKKQTGILRLHAHLLRHTFATNYLVDGGDLETLRLLMGHSDLQVTMMYLHLAENKKLLQRKHQSHLDMIINS